MPPRRRPIPPCAAIALLLAAGPATGRAEPGPGSGARFVVAHDMRPAPPGFEWVVARSDSFARVGLIDSVQATLRPLIARARASRDRAALLWLRRRQAELLQVSGNSREALDPADETVRLARATADTASWISGLRWRYLALGQLGRFGEARRDLAPLRRLATRTGDRYHLAILELIDAWDAVSRGDMGRAFAGYSGAARNLHFHGGPNDEAFARLGAARAALRMGDHAAARREVRRALELAAEGGSLRLQAFAFGDLGMIELDTGDPASGERYYRRSYEGMLALRNYPAIAHVGTSVALALGALGRYDEAAALLDSLRGLCETRGLRSQLPIVYETLGLIREDQGRPNEAEDAYRRVLDFGPWVDASERSDAVAGLARVRVRLGRPLEALDLLEREASSGRERYIHSRIALETTHADVLAAMGRPGEAAELYARVAREADRLELWPQAAAAWLGATRTHDALGRPEQALADLGRAELAWDRSRSTPSAADWRERIGADRPDLTEAAVRLTLESPASTPPRARERAAFERLQRFKSRTLLERMRGPGVRESTGFDPVTLARLQDVVLRDGELLIDTFVGPSVAWVFAVTRDSFRVVPLGDSRRLIETCALHADLVGRPPRRGDASPEVATTRLRRLLFGGLEDLLERAETVMIVPDGALHRVPAAVLLGGRRDPVVTRVPSATTLERLRSTASAQPVAGTLLAIDWSGPGLPGARAEVRELGATYRGVRVAHSDAVDPLVRAEELVRYAGLHFAGHTRVDDVRPWLSELAGVGGPGGGALRAGDVAAMRIRSRLVVLSSCASGAGTVLSGEGIAGLSSAFVASGARTVVVTLWPVDDGTTRRLMRRFYDELSRGRAAGQALALAQRSIRGGRTAHPFYWGGFVLVGERGTHVPLERRPPDPIGLAALSLVALASTGALFALALRRRRTAAPGS